MDYGNEERLLFNQLRPLHSDFSTLPCQALHCSFPSQQLSHPSDLWYELVFDWFSSLLLGKIVKIVASEEVGSDVVCVEVFVPHEEIRRSTLLNLILREDLLKNDFVLLSSFMDSMGLSIVDKELSNGVEDDFIHISHLPPLVVKLNSSQEFTCLMSHVTDDMHFYVHPVQENLAHEMTFISNQLCDHYSTEENCVQLSSEHVQCGSVCCVFSADFQQWCRGVIVGLKREQCGTGNPECLVFYLDYGGSEWMESCKVFPLVKSLRRLASQVVCCSFDEVTANSSRGGVSSTRKTLLTNPDLGSFETPNNYVCSVVQRDLVSKGVCFISSATEGKQLFVIVKENG